MDSNGIDLHDFIGGNRAITFSIDGGVAKYVRWRIEIDAKSPSALVLAAVFQITGFGRS